MYKKGNKVKILVNAIPHTHDVPVTKYFKNYEGVIAAVGFDEALVTPVVNGPNWIFKFKEIEPVDGGLCNSIWEGEW